MQKRICIMFFFLTILYGTISYGQNENNIWYFGDHSGLNFNTNPSSLLMGNPYSYEHDGTKIVVQCDSLGSPLFIVTRDTVRDKNWKVFPNGVGPLDPTLTQQPVIASSSTNPNQYYVFSYAASYLTLHYCIVDMALNGGMGGVIHPYTKIGDSMAGVLATAPHADNRDMWVIAHSYNKSTSRNFYSFLLTGSGLSAPVVSVAGYEYGNPQQQVDQGLSDAIFNPQGTCFIVFENINNKYLGPHLFHFDRQTGKISNWVSIFYKYPAPAGAAFSPDGSKLYVAFLDSFMQYDLSLNDSALIMRSAKKIGINNHYFVGGISLGPDGRIYIGQVKTSYLGVIENPNASAKDVIYHANGFDLGSVQTTFRYLPTEFSYRQIPKAKIKYGYNCFGDSVYFISSSSRQPAKYLWNFGDTLSGKLDTVTGQSPVHYYARPGKYMVRLVVDLNGFKDTVVQTIEVKVSAFSLGPDTTLCAGQSYALSATMPYVRYLWSTGDTTGSIQVKTTGTYWVKAYTSTCARYDTVKLKFVDVRTDLGKDTSICRNGSVTLDAGIDSVSYLWSTGETVRTIQASKAGTYRVTIQRAACMASDSIIVKQAPEPVKVIPESFYLCPDLKETQTVDAGSAKSYLWQPSGYTGQVFTAQDTGLYTLATTNGYGCTRKDTFSVFRRCPPTVYIPNAFTPNTDSLNETFKPTGVDVEEYEMTIYNRWGEAVFHTTNFNEGWDGSYKGQPSPDGLYHYKAMFKGYGKPAKTIIWKIGTLYLVR